MNWVYFIMESFVVVAQLALSLLFFIYFIIFVHQQGFNYFIYSTILLQKVAKHN
jgi:hypothetical protein